MTQTSINIRPMRTDEKQEVDSLMRQSFPLLQQWFFSWTPNVLVAEQNGQLLGAAVLDLFSLPQNRKGGLISWVFTAPEARGLGLGQQLSEAALEFFKEQGCDEVIASIEGYNTSSSKIFASRGFSIMSPGEQFRRYGLGVFGLWAKISHFFEIGHFLWVRPAAERQNSPVWQWWGNVLVNALIAWLAVWRGSGFSSIDPIAFIALPLMVILFFGVRHLAMWLTAKLQGLEVRYRVWESGFSLSIALALFIGNLFPMPGGVYPTSNEWRYRDLLPKLGVMALAGVLPTLILVWAIWALLEFGTVSSDVAMWLDFALQVGKPLILFDIALAFFPFVSFNGRRLWDWNRGLWAILAMAAVVVFFL